MATTTTPPNDKASPIGGNQESLLLSSLPKSASRAIRRTQLRQMIPLSDTTIYEMEQRGEFPKRFYLTARCAAWDLGEVLLWLEKRKEGTRQNAQPQAPYPDVRLRRRNPIKAPDRRHRRT